MSFFTFLFYKINSIVPFLKKEIHESKGKIIW